jgi:molybdopterin-guanine dinucleotide biosynthesis protein A
VLRPRFADIAIVAGDAAPFASTGLPVVPDPVAGGGPLAGIAAALAWSPRERVFVVACDMPHLDGRVIDRLCAAAAAADVAAAAPVVVGRPEPLHAVYARRCLAVAERRLAAGQLKAADLLADVGFTPVAEAELRAIDAGLRFLTNVNRPEDV